ncbi:hypothetical protein [Comamonas composti]|uniref:hypothetical protein n=1 Tax=Comamonas composti TaxID=408558 RepID=UPI0012EB3F4C|nr:hypothetical protein [Comamonas composti]
MDLEAKAKNLAATAAPHILARFCIFFFDIFRSVTSAPLDCEHRSSRTPTQRRVTATHSACSRSPRGAPAKALARRVGAKSGDFFALALACTPKNSSFSFDFMHQPSLLPDLMRQMRYNRTRPEHAHDLLRRARAEPCRAAGMSLKQWDRNPDSGPCKLSRHKVVRYRLILPSTVVAPRRLMPSTFLWRAHAPTALVLMECP